MTGGWQVDTTACHTRTRLTSDGVPALTPTEFNIIRDGDAVNGYFVDHTRQEGDAKAPSYTVVDGALKVTFHAGQNYQHIELRPGASTQQPDWSEFRWLNVEVKVDTADQYHRLTVGHQACRLKYVGDWDCHNRSNLVPYVGDGEWRTVVRSGWHTPTYSALTIAMNRNQAEDVVFHVRNAKWVNAPPQGTNLPPSRRESGNAPRHPVAAK